MPLDLQLGGRLHCLKLHRVIVCLICFATANGCTTAITVAQCRVVDEQGVDLLVLKPIYPAKRWNRYRINQDLFIDLRYDIFTSSVGVRIVNVPHYPWTFSEIVIDRANLKMNGAPSPTGVLVIDHAKPGAQIMCQESKST